MRIFLLLCLLFSLSACSSGRDKRLIELAYARNAYEQSVDAYQICTEENIHNLSKCAPLIKLMDEDKKRLERLSKQ